MPQESNLGPLLFLLYVIDVVNSLSCQKLLFADDLKLFLLVSDPGDCDILQENLNTLSTWSASNRQFLNRSKGFVVTCSRTENIFVSHLTINLLLGIILLNLLRKPIKCSVFS